MEWEGKLSRVLNNLQMRLFNRRLNLATLKILDNQLMHVLLNFSHHLFIGREAERALGPVKARPLQLAPDEFRGGDLELRQFI